MNGKVSVTVNEDEFEREEDIPSPQDIAKTVEDTFEDVDEIDITYWKSENGTT